MLVLVAVAATTSNFRFANDMGVVVFFLAAPSCKRQTAKLQAARPLGHCETAKPAKPNQKINTLTRFGQTIR